MTHSSFIIRYPMPIWVWINRGASGLFSSFRRSVAIYTRTEPTSFSQLLPQTLPTLYRWVSTFPVFAARRLRSRYSMGVRCSSSSFRKAQPETKSMRSGPFS